MHISSLEQQQSKGLDTSPGVKLAGNRARGYTKARTTQPARRVNLSKIQPITSCFLTTAPLLEGEPWSPTSAIPLPRESHTSRTFMLGVSGILYVYTGAMMEDLTVEQSKIPASPHLITDRILPTMLCKAPHNTWKTTNPEMLSSTTAW